MQTMSWIAEVGTSTLNNIIKRSTTNEWRNEMRRFLTALGAMASINDRSGKHPNGANQWRACAPVSQPGGEAMNGRAIKMRCKSLAKLFAVSVIILTGSPALATQVARHDAHCSSSEQKAGACRHLTFGTCVPGESCAPRWSGGNTTHDDWPANMILG
jgi:hypothetical protein